MKEIELRSDEVQEVMGQIPAWIVRWGITILFFVVLTLLVGSCFFKYPDVIVAEMTLTSRHPVAQVVSRTAGKISLLYVVDGQEVVGGTPLAIIENPAVTEDVLLLKSLLLQGTEQSDSLTAALLGIRELGLGEMQDTYTGLLTSLHAYKNYQELDYYPKKMASIRGQVNKYQNYYRNQLRQQQVMEAQYRIAGQQYARDSLLFFVR